MAFEHILPVFAFAGADRPNDPALRAWTADEGPQIVLGWENIPIDDGGVAIVRSKGAYPEKYTDGEVVFESANSTLETTFADVYCRPGTVYYYTRFSRLDGKWVIPRRDDGEVASGARAWGFSGAAPCLVPIEPASVVVPIAEDYALELGDTTLELGTKFDNLAALGFARGRWARVGTRTQFYDIMVLEVFDTNVLRFELVDELPEGVSSFPEFTRVELMNHTRMKVVDIAQRRMTRKRLRQLDLKADQGRVLAPTELEDGAIVAAGQPGKQYGYERYTRIIYAQHAQMYSCVPMIPRYLDNLECPLEALRYKSGMYGRQPFADDVGHEVREFALAEPHVVNWRGVEERTQKRVEIATGQQVGVRYGANSVIRFASRTATQPARYNSRSGVSWHGQGFIHAGTSVGAGAGENAILDVLGKFRADALQGVKVRVYHKATGVPTEFTILTNDIYGKMILDGDPGSAGTLYYLNYGQSDNVIPFRGGVAVQFVAAGNKAILTGGSSWSARGVQALMGVVFGGATNAGNNNGGVPFIVDKVSTTTNPDDTLELLEGTVVNEGPSSVIHFHGGIYGNYLMHRNPTGDPGFPNEFPTLAGTPGYNLTREWVIPNVNDVGGAHGLPRTFKIAASNKRWVRVTRGSLNGVANPGDEYRIFSHYQLVLPKGTRRDKRTSFWNSRAGFFNDCGLAFYVFDALTEEKQARSAAELIDSKGLTESLYLISDGTGAARIEVALT